MSLVSYCIVHKTILNYVVYQPQIDDTKYHIPRQTPYIDTPATNIMQHGIKQSPDKYKSYSINDNKKDTSNDNLQSFVGVSSLFPIILIKYFK